VRETACRLCGGTHLHVFADLRTSPLANAYISAANGAGAEAFYPLRALVCDACLLVQLEEFATPEALFSHYAYFSSYSTTWLRHCEAYVAAVVARFGIGSSSKVVEVASNDGYLLQYFASRGIPVLGIDPAANVAAAARERGIPTLVRFFGREAAAELGERHAADLLIANNVLAHVPDLNDFVGGLAFLLGRRGVLTLEFPHLLRLVADVEFDTIYHEHLSYFSFATAARILAEHGLVIFDVEEVPTHGGSLRLFVRHRDDESKPVSASVANLHDRERKSGLERLETYLAFDAKVHAAKRELLSFLVDVKERGKSIAGYGAPAKATTLLNYCGIGTDFIDYTVDRNSAKQGRLLPGCRIPILPPEEIERTRPDLLFILPWNLADEIKDQLSYVRDWGGQFLLRGPELRVEP
jgi:2-polyprenyl-3-methyl-5-hydroxy-6-metoxy-1,4-benzoquinol methylase